MLAANRQTILERLDDDALVLDIGGWADPLGRADWVMDLMPYESRGLYEREGWIERQVEPERFSERTWVQRDLCDREPFPFADGEFDFVVCSHTLEDVRDPIWVCGEMVRVGKAGYVEVPSRLEEQSWGVAGPYVGWPHHHWLIDADDRGLRFTIKPHSIHAQPPNFFPTGFWEKLSDEERVTALWWEGSFPYEERLFVGESMDDFLSALVERGLAERGIRRGDRHGLRRWTPARVLGRSR